MRKMGLQKRSQFLGRLHQFLPSGVSACPIGFVLHDGRARSGPDLRIGFVWPDGHAPCSDERPNRWMLWYNGRRGGFEQTGLAIHPGCDLGFPDE